MVVDRLKPEEAETVLHRLLAAHPELRAEAEQTARSLMGEVSFESIAEEVEDAVGALDLDDLNSRAGRHEWGYTEPTEAAWELLEKAVGPFLEDMKRQMELGLATEALEICKGVVLRLYRLRDRKEDAFLGWASDFPEEAAADPVSAWAPGSARGDLAGEVREGAKHSRRISWTSSYPSGDRSCRASYRDPEYRTRTTSWPASPTVLRWRASMVRFHWRRELHAR